MSKRKGLFGVEHDAMKIGKGVLGAVAFDLALHNFVGGHRRGGRGDAPNDRGETVSDNPVAGVMAGIEDMTGMHGRPVMMAVAGLLLMQTEWREFGEGMALIGAYNAVTSHRSMRHMGAGVHAIEGHDVLAAIEAGVEERLEAMHKESEQQMLLSDDHMGDSVNGIEGPDNEFTELFKKTQYA